MPQPAQDAVGGNQNNHQEPQNKEIMKKTFKFEGRYINLEATAYQNNDTLAILVYYDDAGDDYDVLTVNLNHPDSSGINVPPVSV